MNPTNEQREQARAIMYDGFELQAGSLGLDSKAVRRRIDMIASALSSRDAEVREVLEGLATYRNPQCWCPPDTETEPHSEACRATSALYTKLQPKENGNADDETISR